MLGKTPFVYLAGPIDRVSRQEATEWRAVASRLLVSHAKCIVFNPATAFSIPEGLTGFASTVTNLQSINDQAIKLSDCVLARLSPNVISTGTTGEILLAHSLNIPVVVWADPEDSRMGDPLLKDAKYRVTRLDDAIERTIRIIVGHDGYVPPLFLSRWRQA
jgi:nucleoside 2-deoxyribosyltransferase